MKRIKRIYEQEDETIDAIRAFIETDWSESDEEVGKAISILEGLAYSDDDVAKQFIEDLDQLSNTMNVEDYEKE